jgi:hypothetical protein
MDSYNQHEWIWPNLQQPAPQSAPAGGASSYQNIYDQTAYVPFVPENVPETLPVRPPALSTPHNSAPLIPVVEQNPTPPPQQQQNRNAAGGLVKAQPAFKPTWHGFLDTTKDAMTVVEAALQGRLNHINRRPHDKERLEMLVSGTVLVYEENASGIKRWTDASYWSPSRVLNNYLIYRQLVRPLKPDEKKAGVGALNAGKRKRKESASPSVTNMGDSLHQADDEFSDAPMYDGGMPSDMTPNTDINSQPGNVYRNFAQNLTPEQQRRFCGSLVDSYEFLEGGLMKKTISIKFKGSNHHVISYYSLEDVVEGKLKRPCEDPQLDGIEPRQELLQGWKVSLDEEESRDYSMISGYAQPPPSGHVQNEVLIGGIAQPAGPQPTHSIPQAHQPLPLGVTASANEYWRNDQPQQYAQQPLANPPHFMQQTPAYGFPSTQPNVQYTPQPYAQPHSAPPQFAPYPPDHPETEQYHPHHHGSTPQHQPTEHYASPHHTNTPQHQPTEQYPPQHHPAPSSHQFAVPQPQYFDLPIHNIPSAVPQHDHRRASVPIKVETQEQHPPSHFSTTSPTTYYSQSQAYPPGNPGNPTYRY